MFCLPYPRRCRHCQVWTLPRDLADHEHACHPHSASVRRDSPLAAPAAAATSATDEAARLLESFGPALGAIAIERRGLVHPSSRTPPPPPPVPAHQPPVHWEPGHDSGRLLWQDGLTDVRQLYAAGFRPADVPALVQAGHAARLHDLGVTPTWLREHGRTRSVFGHVRQFNPAEFGLTRTQWRQFGVRDPVKDLGIALSDWIALPED